MDNFENFFDQGINWMNYLNKDMNIGTLQTNLKLYGLKRSIYIIFFDEETLFKNVYEYPDRDLCFFKDFPHDRLVYPSLNLHKNVTCTCTIIWLIKNSKYYFDKDYTQYIYGYSLNGEQVRLKNCHNSDHRVMQKLIEACNFPLRFKKCLNKAEHHKNVDFFVENTFYFNIKWLQYIVEIYFQTFFSILGIFTNILSILVINNKIEANLKKNLDNIMYKHIKINAWFNMFHCIIKLTSLVNTCIFPRTSFCSSIQRLEMIQYYKIYVVFFMGNAIRICSKVSYICFSLSRYYSSTTNNTNIFNKFKNINLNYFYMGVFSCSLAFSSFKLFQFKPNDYFGYVDANYPFDAYSIEICENYLCLGSTKFLHKKCKIYTSLNFINNIFNNFLFFIISIKHHFICFILLKFTQNVFKIFLLH